ncbi:MAG: aspartate aminotransferase family protein [Actinomycetota bacterium]|nr:aspartate aminotransferase family protein [Acidimicrobiaceae bacterium]MCS5674329.1 aspartate aminotransferase family protein [Acidimicrobiales bacterium]MED5540484.1 aspartate aminotransferase family protein [Actinomycetota bacterium]MEE2806917.1 aspartate aminotransferase family protein [Actinomycetota bacterium]|tara:strand:- start:410 stop:1735 length:1326 start_codon:yes stop_codon:yes gene_type:complete
MGNGYPASTSRSAELHRRGLAVIPDGVSRSTVIIRPHPIYVDNAKGAWITDVDGNRYLDCNNNFTSIILGHADPVIEAAVRKQLGRGTAFSMATEAEIELAEILCSRISSCEQMRFCNSGTEGVMGAIKAARAFTGRPTIIKVEGSYHGTYDHAEASLGSDPSNWGLADAPSTVPYAQGAPDSLADEVVVVQFNDAHGAVETIRRVGTRLAAVLCDLMPSRVGMPVLDPTFSEALRTTTREVGALLILDEVISFRLAHGGAQAIHGIDPDLTVLAKIIGGGFPVGAIGGRSDVMEVFAAVDGDRAAVPSGGTYTANPVTMTAGVACMRELTGPNFDRLDDIGNQIRQGLEGLFEERAIEWQVTGAGSLFRIHPHQRRICSYRDAHLNSDETTVMTSLQHRLLEREVYLSGYGMGCVNLATSDADIHHFLGAASEALRLVVP